MLYYTYSYLIVFYLKKNGLIKSVFLMLVNYRINFIFYLDLFHTHFGVLSIHGFYKFFHNKCTYRKISNLVFAHFVYFLLENKNYVIKIFSHLFSSLF